MKKLISTLFLLLSLCALAWFFLEDHEDPPLHSPTVETEQRQKTQPYKTLETPGKDKVETPEPLGSTDKALVLGPKSVRAKLILQGFGKDETQDWTKKAKVYLVQKNKQPLLGQGSDSSITWELPKEASGIYEIALEEELELSREEPAEWYYKLNSGLTFVIVKRHSIDASLAGLQELTVRIKARRELTTVQVHVMDANGQNVEGATFSSNTKLFHASDYFYSKTDPQGRALLWLPSAENYQLRAYWSGYSSKPVKVSKPFPGLVLFRLQGEQVTMELSEEKRFFLKFDFGAHQSYDELRVTLYLKKSWEKFKDIQEKINASPITRYNPKFNFIGKKGVYRAHIETRTRKANLQLILDERGVEQIIDVQLEKKDFLTGVILLSDGRPAVNAGIVLQQRKDPNSVTQYSSIRPTRNGRFKIPRHSFKTYLHVVEPNSEHSVTEIPYDQSDFIIQLKPGKSLSGQLQYWNGQPVPFATLSASIGKNDQGRYLKTDERGAFSIIGLKATEFVNLEIYGNEQLPDLQWTVRLEKGLQLRLPKTHSLELDFRRLENSSASLASARAILLKQAKQYPGIKASEGGYADFAKADTIIHGLLPGDYLLEIEYNLPDGSDDTAILWKTVTIPFKKSKLNISLNELSSVKVERGLLPSDQELDIHLLPSAIKRTRDLKRELPDDLESLTITNLEADDSSTVIEGLSPGQYWLYWTSDEDEETERGGQWVTIAPNQVEQLIRLR